jgi:DNA-directed RNA polymerase, subunit M/Transcription elongation factor TFIIS
MEQCEARRDKVPIEIRSKVKSLFQKVLTEDESILLEEAIHEYFLKHSETTYQNLAYQIYGKLSATTSIDFVPRFASHSSSPSSISNLIQQIKDEKILFQGPEFRSERDKDEKEAKNIETPLDVKEGVNKCSKCGSKKTFQFSLQIRSCDEPATIFLTCAMCGHRWRIG